jgi:ribosomal protein L14
MDWAFCLLRCFNDKMRLSCAEHRLKAAEVEIKALKQTNLEQATEIGGLKGRIEKSAVTAQVTQAVAVRSKPKFDRKTGAKVKLESGAESDSQSKKRPKHDDGEAIYSL